MTQREGPDQRGGGVQGDPQTFKSITIDKFSGLNTVSPRGKFGQPNVLRNVVLDRLGGYALAPGLRVNFTGIGEIINMGIFDGGKFWAESGGVLYIQSSPSPATFTPAYNNVATYQRGALVGWETEGAGGGITVFTLNENGSGRETELTSRGSIDFDIVPSDQGATDGGGVTTYPKTSFHGFNPKHTNYLMIFREPWPDGQKPKLGTTLNPGLGAPQKLRPFIIRIPPQTSITNEYMVRINNPGTFDYHIYGASLPSTRSFKEYVGGTIKTPSTRSTGGNVPEGTLVRATPINSLINTDGRAFDNEMLYQAINTGASGANTPAWPGAVGSTIQDGDVVWINKGPYFSADTNLNFDEFVARVSNGPIDYIPPSIEWRPVSNGFGEWAQLQTGPQVDGIPLKIYRSRDPSPSPHSPHSFFPVGLTTELHAGRTWVAAEAVWRVYAQNDGVNSLADFPLWELTNTPRTVYYSEPDTPWLFVERFIAVPLMRSDRIVAMRSLGEYLVLFGNNDAAVIAGDSEANFSVSTIDIPGAYDQRLTAALAGAVYYRGKGGFYKLQGGQAVKISSQVATLVPDNMEYTEELTVDRINQRLFLRVGANLVLCYDVESDSWTTVDYAGRLMQVFEQGTFVLGEKAYTVDDSTRSVGYIEYRDLDAGAPHFRKRLLSVSMNIQGEGGSVSASLTTTTNRQDGQNPVAVSRGGRLVDQTNDYLIWRTPNSHGHSFGFGLTLAPAAGANAVLKPGITLELQPEGVMRR